METAPRTDKHCVNKYNAVLEENRFADTGSVIQSGTMINNHKSFPIECISENRRILVTAIGTVNGGSVVEELRNHCRNIYIIGANSTPAKYAVTSKFVDEFYQFPSSVDNPFEYIEYVLNFCREHTVSHIMCFIDEEASNFAKNKNRFDEIGVRLCLADYETIEICHFKDKFTKWIEERFPKIAIKSYGSDVKVDSYPIFVKPIEGRASNGCMKINNAEEMRVFFKNNNVENYVMQEYIEGDIVGVDIIRNRNHKQFMVVQKKELMRNSNGCGTVVEIVDDSALTDICYKLAENLDLNGVINAEFFVTEAGYKIIEINPRLPAGTSYSCMAGGNTVINSLLISENKACQFENIKIGKIYARRYETYEM